MPEKDNEVAALVEAFKVFNRSGNGMVTPKELLHVMTSMGEKLTEEEAREVLDTFDGDSKGGINYEEFVQLAKLKV